LFPPAKDYGLWLKTILDLLRTWVYLLVCLCPLVKPSKLFRPIFRCAHALRICTFSGSSPIHLTLYPRDSRA
jgi:hypothetical protein